MLYLKHNLPLFTNRRNGYKRDATFSIEIIFGIKHFGRSDDDIAAPETLSRMTGSYPLFTVGFKP